MFDHCFDDLADADLPDALPCTCTLKSFENIPPRDRFAYVIESLPTVPSAHPYVLLNYQGKTRDVMTLAHELGHGVHQVLAAKQGPLMAPTPLTLAETASVFGEMLTFKRLLAETKDKKARKAMLASKVEDMLNTVVPAGYFVVALVMAEFWVRPYKHWMEKMLHVAR